MKKLTDKQSIFIRELIKGSSQRQAYKKAYPSSKRWKKDNAVDSKASQLFNSAHIQQRYLELKKKADDNAIMSRNEALSILSNIGRASVVDCLDDDGIIDFNKIKTPKIKHAIKSLKLDQYFDDDGKLHNKTDITSQDNIKAISAIAKLENWNKEKELNIETENVSISLNF